MKIKHYLTPLIVVLVVLISGCETRSISNSEYQRGWYRNQTAFRGEISELDILGTSPDASKSDQAIREAFEKQKAFRINRGDKALLIQSGAMMPDASMLDIAGRYFLCAPFSGVPPEGKENLSNSLRLRAAQGGFPYLICYWGVLESGKQDHEGAVISWVPILGGLIPDSKEQMRISLKAIVLDVQSGSWKMITYQSEAISRQSAGWTRESTDQAMVAELKRKGYEQLIDRCLQ